MYGELTEAESEQLERLAACKDLKEQAAKVPAVTFGRLSSKKDESVDPAKRELAKSIRNSVKRHAGGSDGTIFQDTVRVGGGTGKSLQGAAPDAA